MKRLRIKSVSGESSAAPIAIGWLFFAFIAIVLGNNVAYAQSSENRACVLALNAPNSDGDSFLKKPLNADLRYQCDNMPKGNVSIRLTGRFVILGACGRSFYKLQMGISDCDGAALSFAENLADSTPCAGVHEGDGDTVYFDTTVPSHTDSGRCEPRIVYVRLVTDEGKNGQVIVRDISAQSHTILKIQSVKQ